MNSSPTAVHTKFARNFNGKAQQGAAASTDLSSKAPSWRKFIAVHPAADRIPAANEDEKLALATDLARQGQRQPVILVRVATRPNTPLELLDGRTRLDLLSAAGIDVVDDANGKILVQHRVVQVADDAEAEQLSLSLNVHRRHLTAEQKHELIAQLLAAAPEKSNRQIAETVKADHKTVASVRAEKESTGEIPQLTKTVGKDGKARKQPANKAAKKAQKKLAEKKSEESEPAAVAIGTTSTGEAERLATRNEELENKCRQLEFKIEGLESEIEELKTENTALRTKLETAQKASTSASPEIATTDTAIASDPGPIPDFLQRKPKGASASDSSTGVTLGDAISNAFNELTALGCECRDVVDNAPEGLDQSARIQILNDAANILEDLNMPDISAELASVRVNLPKLRRVRSRGDQRDAALSIIAVCTEALDAIDANDPRYQEACALCSELQNASSEVEGCEFPGWCG